jgi:signal peptidase I
MVASGDTRVISGGPDAPAGASDPPRPAWSAASDSDVTTVDVPHDEAGTLPIPGAGEDAKPGAGGTKRKRAQRLAFEWIILIAAALLIAFLIKTFLFQAFYIPSESMVPTLNVGDRVLVNKQSYNFHDVNRGDIVVFEAPPRARSPEIEDLVKRVIGLPGDTVELRDGDVYVDDRRLKEPYLDSGSSDTRPQGLNVPEGCDAPPSGLPGCVVPADHVFVMGDNRIASKDGRVFGPIEESAIVGRVFLRIWPLDDLTFL